MRGKVGFIWLIKLEKTTRHCNVLKFEVSLVPKVVRRLGFAHDHDVLNPDTEVAVLVVSGFYCDDVGVLLVMIVRDIRIDIS